jgi:hypothetical protein
MIYIVTSSLESTTLGYSNPGADLYEGWDD